ncbi:MAG: GNAT family N-acetyltransferase [Clostridiales bacterium]|nr:GNAT family N-acetyltransferase [Clostridiales bacterium]
MKLETQRLILRELTPEDYPALYAVLADSDILKHYPYTFDEKRVRGWIEKNIVRYRVFGFGLWAVVLKETGEMIGDCGITMQNINGSIKPEIGYHIRADYQRRGYAKEAAKKCRDWIFENTPFQMVYSYMKKLNIASSATAKSIGMKLIEEYTDAENETTSVYAIEKSEWKYLNDKARENS